MAGVSLWDSFGVAKPNMANGGKPIGLCKTKMMQRNYQGTKGAEDSQTPLIKQCSATRSEDPHFT